MPDIGGGALLDVGCYNISLSRSIIDAEPQRVCGLVEYDPQMKVDRIASGMMGFGDSRTSVFTCGTQLSPFQRVHIVGTEGRVEIPTTDQYTVQGDLFAKAILEDSPVPPPIGDGIKNIQVIEAIVASGKSNAWTSPQ